MSFGDTPWGHFPLMLFSWFTAFIYLLMMSAIFRGILLVFSNFFPERKSLFRCSYIPLFVAHSVANFLLFLQAELMSQPRKYNWFNLFSKDMTFFAQFSFFYGSLVRYALYVGHVVCAFNRFTVLKFPFFHDQMWTSSVILLFIGASWWMASLFVVPGFLLFSSDIRFEPRGEGLQLIGGRYLEFDSLYGSFLTYSSLAACVFFYLYSFIKLPTLWINKNFRAEKRILICAAFSFAPFLLGASRGLLAYISQVTNIPVLWTISNDLWFYDTEFTFCSQIWINLLMLKQVKESVFRLIKGRPRLSLKTSTENRSSNGINSAAPVASGRNS